MSTVFVIVNCVNLFLIADLAAVETDLLGTASYPKKRLRKVQVETRCISLYNKDSEVAIEGKAAARTVITFNIRKTVMSDTHEDTFMQSLSWPEKGLLRLRLRSENKAPLPWEQLSSVEGESHLARNITDWIGQATYQPSYMCFTCSKWHRLDLMHSVIVSPHHLHIFSKKSYQPTITAFNQATGIKHTVEPIVDSGFSLNF